MTKVYDTAFFIERANKVHDLGTYDYSKSKYVNSKAKLVITCPKHGDFLQVASKHLSGSGCLVCSGKRKKTTTEFIADAINMHGSRYDYSAVIYKTNKHKIIIICPQHGEFKQQPMRHIVGQGCPDCSPNKKMNTLTFISKAVDVHGSNYNYSKVEYVQSKSHVTVTCKLHGDFEQAPNKHLVGQGCPKCSDSHRGRGADCFEKMCNEFDRRPILYVMRCRLQKEVFYKIGITSRTIKERYVGSIHMPYDYTVLHIVRGNGRYIYELESAIKKLLKGKRHIPTKVFGGHTECFKTIKPVEKLLKNLEGTDQLQLLA